MSTHPPLKNPGYAPDHRWCKMVNTSKKRGIRGAAECVTNFLSTFWGLLWSFIEQTHGMMTKQTVINADVIYTSLLLQAIWNIFSRNRESYGAFYWKEQTLHSPLILEKSASAVPMNDVIFHKLYICNLRAKFTRINWILKFQLFIPESENIFIYIFIFRKHIKKTVLNVSILS